MKNIIDLIARILISIFFFLEAYKFITAFKETKELMAAYRVIWHPDFLLVGAIILLIAGAILLSIGYRTSFAVVLLLLYLIPITFMMHSWWLAPEDMRETESILFMKNVAIIGGLLMIFVNGSGRYSVKRLFATTKVKS